jgi:chemotaxis protein MotB
MIRRKPIDDEEDNPDRWLVSYADFITLLFAFFVVMYGISSVNQSKYNQLSSSMGTAFSKNNNVQNAAGLREAKGDTYSFIKQPKLMMFLPKERRTNEKKRKEHEAMTAMGVQLSNNLAPLVQQGKVHVMQNNRGIRIDIHDNLLFNSGSAQLSSSAYDILSEIALSLRENKHAIQVEGHTDNTPIHTPLFFSNWELSAVRASSIVRMFSESGVAENRLSALGFGASQPIGDNETPEGRTRNRRVSIMILYDSVSEDGSDNNEIKPDAIYLEN